MFNSKDTMLSPRSLLLALAAATAVAAQQPPVSSEVSQSSAGSETSMAPSMAFSVAPSPNAPLAGKCHEQETNE